MSSRSPSSSRCGASRNTQVPLRLPRSRTTSVSCSQEILACSGDRNTSSGNRMSPSCRPMVVSRPARSKRCAGVPASSSSTSVMLPPAGAAPGETRRASPVSPMGAPQVAQNRVAVPTAEPQRPQLGPEPGALRRRPQWGQNGRAALTRAPQNGQGSDSPAATATAAARGRVAGFEVAPPVMPVDRSMGLPQSIQTGAPGSESLHVTVAYPAPTDVLESHDSAFLFGAVRGARGPVHLGINGQSVPVLPDGGWIAWVPLPDDTVAPFLLAATAGPDSSRTVVTAHIAPRFHPPPGRAAWIDTTSFMPVGTLGLPAGEGVLLSVQAAPGASLRLVLPWGSSVPLVPDTLPAEPAWSVRAFVADTAAYRLPPAPGRYLGWLPAGAMCADGRTACGTLVVAAAGDSATARWPLTITTVDMTFPQVVLLNDDTAHTGTTDSITPGRAVP